MALKMNHVQQGKQMSIRVDKMYEKGKYIPSKDWFNWISSQF